MNFLVIGSGAREHIIAEKLDIVGVKIFSVLTNMNPGLLNMSKKYIFVNNYKLSMETIVAFALANSIDCVIIGPEEPLSLGLSDLFWKNGIPVIGPLKVLAQIETSKGFTRDLLNKYNIDVSPNYKRFDSLNGVRDFMEYLSGDYVVKFDGLMGGKGVKVSGEHLADINAGLKYCNNIINNSGNFVIEEKLVGEEFSLMSFCDGQNLAHMPAIQDSLPFPIIWHLL
jgi:fusion protein PurCD